MRIGLIGGGQLGRMMAQENDRLGLGHVFHVLDPNENCPMNGLARELLVGDYNDADLTRELALKVDVITYEIERGNIPVLKELRQEGLPIHPDPGALEKIKDKYLQAEFLRENDIPVPGFRNIGNVRDLEEAVEEFGRPLMLKARHGSYDGNGNKTVYDDTDLEEAYGHFNGMSFMAQQYVEFEKEISVIAARSVYGYVRMFPIAENEHGQNYNILKTSVMPAQLDQHVAWQARDTAQKVMDAFDAVGVFGIEMFVDNGQVCVNEIAPRVHNTGHATIEACAPSQFAQHLYAVTGRQLGDIEPIAPAVMKNILGPEDLEGEYQVVYSGDPIIDGIEVDGMHVHLYGKSGTRPHRKLGHVTILGEPEEVPSALTYRADYLMKNLEVVSR